MSAVLCKDGVKRFSFVGPAFLLIPTHRHWEGPRVSRVSEARILSVILNVYQCYLFLADVEVYLTHQKKSGFGASFLYRRGRQNTEEWKLEMQS